MRHSQTTQATELNICRIGGGRQSLPSVRPAGTVSLANPLKITAMKVGDEISNCQLGVSRSQTIEEIPSVSIASLVFIQRVDVREDGEGTVTYMAPSSGCLPERYL
eukprot:evm.model.scf_534.6 EVM.evm.TU.scf_534.6   scf_534:38111-38428(-)